eukprot:Protomagalhaensia_sp_Gyna_25__1436@NODE_1726_length_1583_cov_98_032383_g1415_i0_p2_GENE_NODE_1726_length_1583_cov_98_032383_g1415_i0NODE_1726_length_1583_cov_98_032383_g1415_i0_p2_ORF_typecomplete_len100_score15_61_NODE_1726_length_1583_cov_98_032383_g1415_i011311430
MGKNRKTRKSQKASSVTGTPKLVALKVNLKPALILKKRPTSKDSKPIAKKKERKLKFNILNSQVYSMPAHKPIAQVSGLPPPCLDKAASRSSLASKNNW